MSFREEDSKQCVLCHRIGRKEEVVGDVRIAVHVRRGDIVPTGHYAVAYLTDDMFLSILRDVMDALNRVGQSARIVVYSEAYGRSDWAKWKQTIAYAEGVSSIEFKLSTTHSGSHHSLPDSRAMLRTERPDIYDFVASDILIIGGTFSAITGLLRPPSAGTTFFLRDNHGYFGYAKNLAPAWWIGFDRDGHIEAPFAITVRGKQIAFSEDHPDRTGTTGDA